MRRHAASYVMMATLKAANATRKRQTNYANPSWEQVVVPSKMGTHDPKKIWNRDETMKPFNLVGVNHPLPQNEHTTTKPGLVLDHIGPVYFKSPHIFGVLFLMRNIIGPTSNK